MDGQPDDWDLLARAPGDEVALRQLFQRHRHYVYRLAWGVLGEEHAADDVVQDVFLRIHTGRVTGTRRARFTTWLYKVAFNTAREHARLTRRVRGDGLAAEALRHMADHSANPARVETAEDLKLALAALEGRQREVVLLRLLEGFDTAETAEILGCRQGTVKAHLHRATLKLKDLLTHP